MNQYYEALTGYPPFRWQQRLWAEMVAGNLPEVIDIPTGLGKTAIIPIWLLAIAAQSPLTLPRRLIYVVNRRTVVDQATDIAQRVRKRLPAIPEVFQALGKFSADPVNPLAISTLRGELQDNKEWQTDPARPAIVIGTVDMIGSKLLFAGYQSSRRMRPFMAGLIGQDVLLIHDEAHLTPAFGHLIRQIIQTQYKQGNPRPLLPEEPAPDHLIDPDLIQMNQKYAVVRIGGKTRVVWFEEAAAYPGCKVSVFSTISDFCAFHAKRKKFVVGRDGRERKIGIGKWWINHEQRRQFSGLVYAPSVTAKITNGKLNLWNGFGCKPRTGKCDRYLAHLRDNICCGNEEHAHYLLNWMAYAVQHPDRQGEVAVVMRGKEGTGKGVAAKQFGQLLGSHFRHIVHAKHLTGHFNAHLQQCSVLFADEAFFAGDRSHESILKALITEETLLIEPKGIDPFPARNCVHLIMSSNNDWVIPAGADARRYFVLNVADSHMQDHEYFAAIAHEMDNGGREALLHYLLSRDLAGFNIRLVPQTKALAEQKTHSRRGVDRLIEILCHEGVIPFAHETYSDIAITSGEERGEGFYYGARSLVPDFKYVSSIVISQALKEHWECVPWKAGNRRGIKFPPLGRLRELFDKRHGEQKWPVLAGETDEWTPRSSYDNSRDMRS